MAQNETTVISYSRDLPRPQISLSKLQRKIAELNEESGYEADLLNDLGDGRYGYLKSEWGFMEMFFHVALYEASPGLFRKDMLKLVSTEEFPDKKDAQAAFAAL